MFITDEDYIQVGADALNIMQQSNPANRQTAERRALKEVSAYLGGRYDLKAALDAEVEERDDALVGFTIDIALYYMSASLPSRMGFEIRKEFYEKAIAFLKEVQKGNSTLDIPTLTGPNGEEDYNNPIRYGCGQQNRYDW